MLLKCSPGMGGGRGVSLLYRERLRNHDHGLWLWLHGFYLGSWTLRDGVGIVFLFKWSLGLGLWGVQGVY